jgi:hypothetical protein
LKKLNFSTAKANTLRSRNDLHSQKHTVKSKNFVSLCVGVLNMTKNIIMLAALAIFIHALVG